MRLPAAALCLALSVVSCAGGGSEVVVTDARMGRPTGPNAALYLTAVGSGEADRLVAAVTGSAREVQMHETISGDDGTMGMRPARSLELPSDGALVLEPGGFHLMLMGVDRLDVGDTIEVTLTWEKAGEMTVSADVVDPAETMSDG